MVRQARQLQFKTIHNDLSLGKLAINMRHVHQFVILFLQQLRDAVIKAR